VRTVTLSTLALAAALATACGSQPDEPVAAAAPPVAVQVGHVGLAELPRTFESGGIVRARYTASISSRVMAPIAAVHVRAGDQVRRGDVLVTLDARESRANDARANAAYASAVEATLSVEADTRTAQAELQLARATHARIAALYEKRSATAHELDQAVAALAAAEARVSSARARAASALASRDAALATREAASIGLSYTRLTAPFDGVVIERHADPGAMAAVAAPLLTIEDPSLYRLDVQLDAARAGNVRVGQDVELQLPGARGQLSSDSVAAEAAATAPDLWISARVSEIGRVDPTSHSFLVKVDVPTTHQVVSGAFGRARFPGRNRVTMTVPAQAVVRRGQLTIVFTVDAEGRARLRPVSVGAEVKNLIEVLAGVEPGEVVVVNPPAALGDGTPVDRR
jgi:RND family efflux transporter MFP subunit